MPFCALYAFNVPYYDFSGQGSGYRLYFTKILQKLTTDFTFKGYDKSKYNDLIVCHLSFRRRSNVYNRGRRFQHNPHECL